MQQWNKKQLITIGITLIPILFCGFNTLEDPEYYPDSNGKPSIQQKLDFLGINTENSPKTEDERFDNMPTAGARTIASVSTVNNNPSVESHISANNDLEISPAEASAYGVQEFSIIVTDKGFLPNKIIVRRNIPVNLYLTSVNSKNLCFVLKNDEYGFHTGVNSKQVETLRFNPQKVGPYKFHCPINNLEGTMIVRD